MFSRESKQTARIDTLVGKTSRVQGDVEFAGGLHLDGHVAGNVRAAGRLGRHLVGERAWLHRGPVEVPNVVLNGTVNGDIHASGAGRARGPGARCRAMSATGSSR